MQHKLCLAGFTYIKNIFTVWKFMQYIWPSLLDYELSMQVKEKYSFLSVSLLTSFTDSLGMKAIYFIHF